MLAPDPAAIQPPPADPEILALRPRLLAFLQRMAGVQDAEDLCQESLARALRSRRSFDASRGTLSNWLMKTAFRTYLDHRKRSSRAPDCLGEADVQVPAPRQDDAAGREELDRLLARLKPIEADILLRFHRQRETIQEISQQLAIPPGTVKSHLHRARMRLLEYRRDEA